MSNDIDKYIKALNEEKARSSAERQALIEEFSKSIPAEWSPDDLKDKIRDLLGEAYATISKTIKNEEEPALAFQASKYVMSIGIGQIRITDDNDPNKELNELLKDLAPKKERTAPLPGSTNSNSNDKPDPKT